MKLYLANATHQKHFFNYKLPERSQPFGIMIESGRQEQIEGDLDTLKHIIGQHIGYGLTDIKDVKPGFSGICYSIDKVITSSQIAGAHEQKQEDLEDGSQKILENSATAITQTIRSTLQQAGSETDPGDIEVKITGEAVNKDQPNAPKLDKKIVVTKAEGAAKPKTPRASRKK